MIGTAIRCGAFWASTQTSPVRERETPRVVKRQVGRQRRRSRSARPHPWTHVILAWVLAVLISLTASVAGSAAHEAVQLVPAAAAEQSLQAVEAPAGQELPKKLVFAWVCTGHCMAHAFAMPTPAAEQVVVPVVRAGWPVLDDQWAQVTRPSRLERPPRA